MYNLLLNSIKYIEWRHPPTPHGWIPVQALNFNCKYSSQLVRTFYNSQCARYFSSSSSACLVCLSFQRECKNLALFFWLNICSPTCDLSCGSSQIVTWITIDYTTILFRFKIIFGFSLGSGDGWRDTGWPWISPANHGLSTCRQNSMYSNCCYRTSKNSHCASSQSREHKLWTWWRIRNPSTASPE